MSGRLRLLLGNLGALILGLLLAFVIWITATLQADPFTTADVTGVPISVVDQPDSTMLLEPLAERATLRVRGPTSVLRTLSPSDFRLTVDLADVKLGQREVVPIQAATELEILRIESIRPAQQTVYLEAVKTVTMPVGIGVRGQAATGYLLLAPAISPEEVVVSGPASALDQVATVSGTLAVDGAREMVEASVTVSPLDAAGNPIAGVDWAPPQVQVQVPVRKKVGFKPDVTVIPDLRGDPAPGYRRGGVTVEPATVTLGGVPSVLDELPGFVRTQPITVSGATEDLTVRTTLTVPNSVVVVDAQFVTVTLQVLPIESSRIVTAAIEVQGLRPGLTATLSPNFVQVILVGPDAVLAALEPDDVRVVLNLFDYTIGTHRIAPVVLPPEGITAVSVLPETMEVVITQAPSPTPGITPTGPP